MICEDKNALESFVQTSTVSGGTIDGLYLSNCAADTCALVNTSLYNCDLVRSSANNCSTIKSPLALRRFPVEIRLTILALVDHKELAAAFCCDTSIYDEAKEIFEAKLISKPLEFYLQELWRINKFPTHVIERFKAIIIK